MAHDHKIDGVNTSGIPSCTRAYAKAVVDPFSDVPDVCLPSTLLPLPSRKFITRATITWQTGTNNVGALIVVPQYTWTSGLACFYASGSTFPGTMSDVVNAAAVGITPSGAVAPMSNGLDTNILVRLCTFGSKTKATTPGMNRGGVMFSNGVGERLDLQASGLARTYQECFADTASVRVPFGTGDTSMGTTACGPTLPPHLDFTQSNTASLGSAYFMIGATSSAPQSFITEFVFYWEVIEQTNTSGLTPSHAEPSFSGAVVAAINSTVMANPGGESHRSAGFLSRVKGLLKTGWDAVRPVVKAVAPSAIRAGLNFVPGVGPALSAIAGAAGPMAMRVVQRAIQSRQPQGRPQQQRIAAKRK